MQPLDAELEPEFEAWLRRLVPAFEREIEGASAEEIRQLEALAPKPLPAFYRWFLARMGRRLGSLGYPRLDFSIDTVLNCYRSGVFERSPRYLMIAYHDDDLLAQHIAYDFEFASERDARAVSSDGSNTYHSYASFREHFSIHVLRKFVIWRNAHLVRAVLTDEITEDVPSLLDPVMQALGFASPFETSQYCRLYQRGAAALICDADIDELGLGCMSITLGAPSEGELRSILGHIRVSAEVEISDEDWNPPRPR